MQREQITSQAFKSSQLSLFVAKTTLVAIPTGTLGVKLTKPAAFFIMTEEASMLVASASVAPSKAGPPVEAPTAVIPPHMRGPHIMGHIMGRVWVPIARHHVRRATH